MMLQLAEKGFTLTPNGDGFEIRWRRSWVLALQLLPLLVFFGIWYFMLFQMWKQVQHEHPPVAFLTFFAIFWLVPLLVALRPLLRLLMREWITVNSLGLTAHADWLIAKWERHVALDEIKSIRLSRRPGRFSALTIETVGKPLSFGVTLPVADAKVLLAALEDYLDRQ